MNYEVESLVSIGVPNFNGGNYIESCLESILNQTYKNIEILIADGGSKDNSFDIIEKYVNKYKNIRLISSKDNGQADAINKCIDASNGKYFTWLNSDDKLEINSIAYAVKALNKDQDIALVYGSVLNTHLNGDILQLNAGLSLPKEDLLFLDFIPQTGAVFKKFDDIRLDQNLHWGLDWDLWIKLSFKGKIFNLNKMMGYCIIEGIEDRKSDQLSPKRTDELVNLVAKYLGKNTSFYYFGKSCVFAGKIFSFLSNIFPNYYYYISRITHFIHKKFIGKRIML